MEGTALWYEDAGPPLDSEVGKRHSQENLWFIVVVVYGTMNGHVQ